MIRLRDPQDTQGDDPRADRNAAGGSTVFLERRSYRRRRLMDAAKLLPVLGAILFLVPLLWLVGTDAEAKVPASLAFVYVFVVWALLIVTNWVFGLAVGRWADNWGRSNPSGQTEAEANPEQERERG